MKRGYHKITVPRTIWSLSVAIVLVVGVCCLPREFPHLGFLESVYYTIRLFVLEHDLPHFPKTWPLILIYFAAPLVSLSAGWFFLKYLFNIAPILKTKWMHDHVVIAGMGKIGSLLASTLETNGVKIVGIDIKQTQEFDDWFSAHKSPILFGDFNSHTMLKRARACRARSIVFATGDDLANLEGAVAAYDKLKTIDGPVQLIWTHVADEQLANTAREAVRTQGVRSIRFFDTYRIAATRIVRSYFSREIRKHIREVNVIGFGKFGRDLVEILVTNLNRDENIEINVIDIADKRVQISSILEELGNSCPITFTQADVRDLKLEDERHKAFFICTDDDLGNLTAAMRLSKKSDCANIYVRMTTWPISAMADHLGEDRGICFINIHNLVEEGLGDLPGLFQPATKGDIKRIV